MLRFLSTTLLTYFKMILKMSLYTQMVAHLKIVKVVSNALLRLAVKCNVTITQKFLEKGHTQMEVDSVHSVIERK